MNRETGLNPFLIRATFESIMAIEKDTFGCLNPFLIRATFESKILRYSCKV